MKKLLSKFDKKFIISLIISIFFLSTFAIYTIFAVTNEMTSTGTGMANGTVGAEGSLYLEDLRGRYDIFCCSHGTALPGSGSGKRTKYTVVTVKTATPMEAYVLAEMINNTSGFSTSDIIFETDTSGNKVEYTDTDNLSSLEQVSFGNTTIYVVNNQDVEDENGTVTNEDSGIGSEKLVMKADDGKYYYVTSETNSGYGVYSYVQRAWWNTDAGNSGNPVPPNELSEEAEQFENYIRQFGDYEIEEQTITDENGNQKTVPAPKLNYEPKDILSNATVSWDADSQTYLAGPFAIDYIEASSKSTNREEVLFAGITDVQLYTDASDEPLVFGEDWEFSFQGRNRSDTAIYPHTNEEFYIKLKYNPEATKIVNIHFDFKYMNAGGKFEDLQGKYYTETENGTIERTAQRLAGGLIGARWYETAELNITPELEGSRIQLSKVVVDEDGNEINDFDNNEYFTFKVTVGDETKQYKVKAGSSVYTDYYYWGKDEKAPNYEVEEIDTNGYELVDIKNESGTLKSGKTIKVTAKNRITNESSLRIVKKITKTSRRDQEFSILVKVTGMFKYEGVNYRNKTLKIPVKLVIPAGSKQAEVVLKNFTWNNEEAPKYAVSEDTSYNTNYELRSINPKKGTLEKNEEVTVTVINEDSNSNKARLHIVKTLENADGLSDDYIESLEFKFKIKVDGYSAYPVKLKAVRQNNEYVWSYISDYFYWSDGENPEYTIEEIELPEGTEFVTADSPDTRVTISGTTVRGTLEDSDGDLKVTNEIVNKVNTTDGSIKITKKVNDEALANNKEYTFVLKVSGTFSHNGRTFRNETETIPVKVLVPSGSTSGTVLIDGFTWDGRAPEYSIEEDLRGVTGGVQANINPSTGTLKKNSTVNITATNYNATSKRGALHIIKTLENANSYSVEYIKSLVFSFNIKVGDIDYGEVSLNAKKVNDDYIWEYTGNYTWSDGEEDPTYTITEVNLPAGTEFVSASSSNGSSSGTSVTGTLKPDSEEDYIIENNFINKLVNTSGLLKIEKKVLDESLNGKSFKFNVKIKGTFEYNGTQYTNATMELNDIEVTGGSTWTSSEIRWFGENAPTYEVVEQDCDFAKLESVNNAAGTLVAGGEAEAQIAIFTNSVKTVGGNIQITKKLEDGATSDEEFKFDIEVEGYEKYTVSVKAGETYRSEEFKWEAGTEAPKYTVTEQDSSTSSFVSISNGTETSTSRSISGNLGENQIVNIVCINKLAEHKGKLKVTKKVVVDEKLQDNAIDAEFKINVVISGSFEMNGESVVDSTRVIEQVIKAGESFETPEIKWYGEKAPTYLVTETNLPTGWNLENISNANSELIADTTVESIVTNSLKTTVKLDLTIDLAGNVWEDTKVDNKEVEQTERYGTQGIYDTDIEPGIDGVEVYVYKVLYDANNTEVSRELAKAYEEDTNEAVSFPVYTQNGGVWNSPRLSVPVVSEEEKSKGYKASFDVEFVYDGQTYEPTDFLKTSNGDSNSYRAATTAKRDAWAKDSMALDYNREEVDNRITQVLGENEIDGNGNTTGKVISSNGEENTVYYKSVDYTEGLTSSRKISELQTKDSNGNIYDIYKTKARTSMGGLTYPFDSKCHLESYDKIINENGILEKYKYTATYNYCLNINLGLLKREDADLGTTKDLYSAKVIANGKMLNYRFNKLSDLTGTTISRQLMADDMNINYQLGVYKTDYYYRAEIYQANGRKYDSVENLYKTLGKDVSSTELDVYLTYKIKMYNESPNYVVSINSVDDYFDSSFGKPITEAETKYVQTSDGVTLENVTEVANKSYVETSAGNRYDVNWEVTEQNIEGSDGIKYNKMVANFGKDDLKLASGEKAEITVTFKVQKQNSEGVRDAIILGQKANVAEIANYSTYYGDGRVAGKIDRDSAPANVNIPQYNDKTWYEDDTDSAPILNLIISGEERQINGIAWEDKEDTVLENNQKVGNGKYDEGEALIGGLTTQLIEKVMVNNPESKTEYTEYDFVWPTSRPLDALGGKTIQSLTGFDSTIETSRTQALEGEVNGLGIGGYRFTGVPAGNYVVRFLYGNDKTELEDSEGITGDPVALKLDGSGNVVNYSENENILIANYDKDLEGKTPAIYNGQDYKSTTYQPGYQVKNSEGYLINEWHDLSIIDRVSDARDNEARRLANIANSTTITNINGEVLATANSKIADHTKLYKDYYMFADTAKINVTIEDTNANEVLGTESLKNETIPAGVEVKVIKGISLRDTIAQANAFTYIIKDVDFGLEERSEANIVLDKQISSIKLTTSDAKTIFNAMYDISYEEISPAEYALGSYTKIAEKDGKYIVAKVELNPASIGTDVLQAINKVEDKDKIEGTQNFRFINVEETILQGSTIEINYLLTALNVSEVDRADSKLENIDQTAIANGTTITEELLKAADSVQKLNSTYTKQAGALKFDDSIKIGSYLGTTYYQGEHADGADSIVTTTVRQLVDYVDNDAVFTATYNNGVDSSWRNVSINEITGNGFDSEKLISKDLIRENDIQDKRGVTYITDQRNNLIVSVDSKEDTETLTNKGFETKLLPYEADNTKYSSSIRLTTSRTVAAESDADSLAFDNLAEIVKYDNNTGRRDVTSVPGNADPKKGEFEVAIEERDTSATELVTLTPPTGIASTTELVAQVLAVVVIALGIVAIGIVVIKKKVLTK